MVWDRVRHHASRLLTGTFPGSRTRAILALALFAAVQIADAAFTSVGVSRFGAAAEANPLVAAYIEAYGLVIGLCAAKAVAITAGAILHAAGQYLILVLLTVVCVFAAIVPWALALASPLT